MFPTTHVRIVQQHSSVVWTRLLKTLVCCEPQTDGTLQSSAFNAITAALQLGHPVHAFVSGVGVSHAARRLAEVQGIDKVLVVEHMLLRHQLAEPLANVVAALQARHHFSHIMAPGTSWGKNWLPRAAALLGVQPVADVTQVVDVDTFVRPVYAGAALATVKYASPGLRIMTVRTSSFAPAPARTNSSAACIELVPDAEATEALQAARVEGVTDSQPLAESQWVGATSATTGRPELGAARVVVCGGRALKTAQAFLQLEALADAFGGGAVGASRAAVDGGMAANELQVGQTGKVVSPELYIGVGISGAIQHMAGIKDSKTIVAINNDPVAPIFQVADYGLVADLFEAIPELERQVRVVKAGRS